MTNIKFENEGTILTGSKINFALFTDHCAKSFQNRSPMGSTEGA